MRCAAERGAQEATQLWLSAHIQGT